MTDAEAVAEVQAGAPVGDTRLAKAIQHCLQAVEDRAAMVAGDDAWAYLPAQEAVIAARRHMRGEP